MQKIPGSANEGIITQQFNVVSGLPQFVTVHAGARDHYQVPVALAEGEILSAFVTDGYLGKTPGLPGYLAAKFFPGASAHHASGLDGATVVIDHTALACSVLEKLAVPHERMKRARASVQAWKDRSLSMTALREARKTDAKLFALSYYAGPAFRSLDAQGRKGLLFQIHPDPRALRDLFLEEIQRQPLAASSLVNEKELQLSDSALDELADEPRLAERIMVASSFTKDSLVVKGIEASKIHVVPYGVDVAKFRCRTVAPILHGPLNIAFVGSFIQRKGISYLLDAISNIGIKGVRLHIFTRGFVDHELLRSYPGVETHLNVGLADQQVIDSLSACDLFVLPSLAEGFGHVLAEAMAIGLPVLASENTMARDLITEGKEGFLVPIRSVDAIQQKLEMAIEMRSALFDMGTEAAKTVRTLTWDRFREGVRCFALDRPMADRKNEGV